MSQQFSTERKGQTIQTKAGTKACQLQCDESIALLVSDNIVVMANETILKLLRDLDLIKLANPMMNTMAHQDSPGPKQAEETMNPK